MEKVCGANALWGDQRRGRNARWLGTGNLQKKEMLSYSAERDDKILKDTEGGKGSI